MMKSTFHIITFTALCAAATASQAGEPAQQTLSANFVMERTIAALSDTLRSEGQLHLGGSGKLRWEMTAPARSVLVIDGATAWVHYPDAGVTKSFDLGNDPVMKVLSRHLGLLTRGAFDEAAAFYEVTPIDGGARRLVPKEPEVKRFFAEIRVLVGAGGTVQWVEMVSAKGDLTKITFSDVKLGAELSPGLFSRPG